MPYCLDPYTLETLGPEYLNGHLNLGCFAAHFRVDSERKVLVFNSKLTLIYELSFLCKMHVLKLILKLFCK